MANGYIYALTNPAMPGIVKIGRTERDPSDRARELRTTGVPSPFELAYSCLVDDCESIEKEIHYLLAKRGVRPLPDREFFQVSPAEAIELIDLVAGKSALTSVDFSRKFMLAEQAASLPLPYGKEMISDIKTEHLVEKLAKIGWQGYPDALKRIADFFEINKSSALRFRDYWTEYLELALTEAEKCPLASGGLKMRSIVGKDAAEYLQRMHSQNWLMPSDFEHISSFLVKGDRFIYEGYIAEVMREDYPSSIQELAGNL